MIKISGEYSVVVVGIKWDLCEYWEVFEEEGIILVNKL